MGWQWAFIITGSIGLIWLLLWFRYYEQPSRQKKLSEAEFSYIHSDADDALQDQPAGKVSWAKLLRFRQTWAYALGKLLTDPIW